MSTISITRDLDRTEDATTPNRFVAWLVAWRQAAVQRAELASLSDRELADIGIARSQINGLCARPSLFVR